WLHKTDGTCQYCRAGRENLCDSPEFTGYTVNGGYAEFIVAPEGFVYAIPRGFPDEQAAPLLCAGIIGFRSLRLSDIKPGGRLGFYGFGAAAHVAIQVARHWKVEVYAATRDARHQKLALELGAAWAGGTFDQPSKKLDAAIVFAPAGEIVPAALKALRKGGVLVLGGIHMSPIPSFSYDLLYQERMIRSVANNTRQDGDDFLGVAAEIPIQTHVRVFPLRDANRDRKSTRLNSSNVAISYAVFCLKKKKHRLAARRLGAAFEPHVAAVARILRASRLRLQHQLDTVSWLLPAARLGDLRDRPSPIRL